MSRVSRILLLRCDGLPQGAFLSMPQRAPKGIRTLSRLMIDSGDFSDAFRDALKEVSDAPDRVAAIVGAAIVEDTLRWALNRFFISQISEKEERELFENEGVLSTFYAKICIAFALGLFGKAARNDLSRVKNIRNAFAHAPRSINFETPQIANECANLRYIDTIANKVDRLILHPNPLDKVPRERFMGTIGFLILDLCIVGDKGEKAERDIKQLGGMP
jgi:hypothetical protein